MFTPTRTQRALYVPPIGNYTFLRSAPAWERMGARFFPTFSGVVMIEAGKQLYAGTAKPPKQRKLARPVVVSLPQATRQTGVEAKSVTVRVDLGGRGILQQTKNKQK